jgi:hypothetical protein
MTPEEIARVCHEANCALQVIQRDPVPSPHWDDAPGWQRHAAVEGVRDVLSGATPEEHHEAWMMQKIADGWVHGPVKDGEAKTHPCLVPYDELSQGQRLKDELFVAIVNCLSQNA